MNTNLIAKNTVFLFFRMLLTMAITLYTSRLVLRILGVEDFGVYNVVAGFVSMLAFFQTSLLTVTQRYLNIALGKKDYCQLKKVFNQSLSFYILIAGVLFILGITIGLWFVNNKLNIPDDRLYAANYTLVFSLFMTVVYIVQVPYQSLIIAHERMNVYAYFAIIDVLMRLLLTAVLFYNDRFDNLILYSILMFVSTIIHFFISFVYCRVSFEESRYSFVWDRKLLSDMFGLLSKSVYHNLVWALGSQGYNILINIYFGPVVNAARGVANQVNNALLRFCETIYTASKPQMTMTYAKGNNADLLKLMVLSTKVACIMFIITAIPLYVYIDEILRVWLDNVPNHSGLFIKIYIVDAFLALLFVPMTNVTIATGKVRRSLVYGKSLPILGFLISLICYKQKILFTPNLVFYMLVFTDFLYFIYMLYDLKRQLDFNILQYLNKCILPILISTVFCFVIACIIHTNVSNIVLGFCILMFILLVCIIFLSWFLILDADERNSVMKIVGSIHQKKRNV